MYTDLQLCIPILANLYIYDYKMSTIYKKNILL